LQGWFAEHVLKTVRTGEILSFRPPAWIERGRESALFVPSNIQVFLLEGGASRDELAQLLDARFWVQSNLREVDRRNEARGEDVWLAEELPWIADPRPWEHSDLIIAGMPTLPHDPGTKIVVAKGLLR
jgi:hypothetical protein